MRRSRATARIASAACVASIVLGAATQALAWGASGHRIIAVAAAEALPADLPAFLHTRRAAEDLGELAREPDRWRNAGKTHDTTRDPGHFVDVSDDGTVFGGPPLGALPLTRADYEAALAKVGTNSYKAGYL